MMERGCEARKIAGGSLGPSTDTPNLCARGVRSASDCDYARRSDAVNARAARDLAFAAAHSHFGFQGHAPRRTRAALTFEEGKRVSALLRGLVDGLSCSG
jgi:hypothetical protein